MNFYGNYVFIFLGLTKEEMQQLAKNSVIASFLSDEEKRELIKEIDAYH